ncbi:ras GTPase-activating protein 1-like [Hydractinia symbiolongicarpus]|uniref:ras GTPase-activating protein 1-like n=1 Tax=Hydractinia symbiolongicarpus TaxID=13093 RepID=UPI002549FC15|nr:ras GTPase-activating protein 1-like [Hydractinia symbiolongicarpus]
MINTDLEHFNYEVREDFDIDDGNDDGDDEFEKLQNYIHEHAPPSERWYHGRLGRKDGEDRLLAHGKSCCYLVRESDRKQGVYSLSYLSLAGHISHFRITAICGDYYIGGRQFHSLQHLIGYYSTYGSLMKDERLKEPVAPSEPVHLGYRLIAKFPYKATADTDELSFNIGDVFSVQNVLDEDWLWVVSQKDNKSGLVPKALTEEVDSSADPFEGRSWFCSVSKADAQTILINYGDVGNFLIRPSDMPGDYSISLRDQTGVSRFRIQRQGQRFIIGGRPFDSIEAIIKRYNKEQLAEGVSLHSPLDRSKYEAFYRNLKGSIRRSGPDLMDGTVPRIKPLRINSRIANSSNITKSGYLIKRGHRNRWKKLYMVLRGEEQQLLYFDNEKRTKPKGLFDLTYAVVYHVHESLFGRPNCFQIVVRALNEMQTYFLCAETSDSAQEWLDVVTQYCGNMRNSNNASGQNVKELKSLELSICHAQKIPTNKVPHPYCVVSLNDVKTCRTKSQEAPEPVFDEDFKFNDLPNDITSFTVAIYNRQRSPYKDKEMGRVTVYLNTLEPGKVLDQWFVLGSLQHKSEIGSIRLTAKFVHEIIMPDEEYGKLLEILLSRDYHMVQYLGEVSKDLNSLAYTLLRIFRKDNNELNLIKTITTRELHTKEKKETLFRGNTLSTKLLDQYMKMIAIPYLQDTIGSVILKIMESKQCCELNPSKVEKGSNVAENLQQLIKFLEEITSNVFNSAQSCPKPLRYLFHCLQLEAAKKWPEEQYIQSRVVSAFLFLRLIVPAVLNPKMHNLVHESPSQMSSRTLTLVAMCLQKLANLVEFGFKEPYLVAVNPFLQKYRKKMVDFLDEIANQSETPKNTEILKHDLARDLAAIHETCIKHEHQLVKLSSTQPNVKILLAIVEGIKRQKEQYMKQGESVCDEFAV